MGRALGENLLRLVGTHDKFEILLFHEIAIAGKPAPTGFLSGYKFFEHP
jgi:beta-phosphoglucomutase-like phosphatase (HAD superfamily)